MGNAKIVAVSTLVCALVILSHAAMAACGGSLSGSVVTYTTTQSINLHSLGTTDWAAFGYPTNATSIERNSSGGSAISALTNVGSGTPGNYNNTSAYPPTWLSSWTSGTPDATISNEGYLVYVIAPMSNGMAFTVPADTTSRTVTVYVSLTSDASHTTQGKLTATLSDGSAVPYSDTTMTIVNGSANLLGAYTITYAAASAPGSGTTLTVAFTNNSSTVGQNVQIYAATLVTNSSVPTINTPPSVAGDPVIGTAVTATDATWNGTVTSHSYQWMSCSYAVCANATGSGAMTLTYTPVTADLDKSLEIITTVNGTSLPSASAGTPGVLTPNAFYISPTGNDTTGFGTLAAPWQSFSKAQTAMQGSSGTKELTYVRGGNYAPTSIANCQGQGHTCGISMGSADNGETFSYYPPDGYNSAIITGGSTAYGNGLWDVFLINSASNITINGLTIKNFQFGGVHSPGGSSGLIVENNAIFNGFVTTQANNAAGFTCYGCASTLVSHNVVYNMAAGGINFGQANGNISNSTVIGNALYNICTGFNDCGAIYFVNQNATIATALTVINNFIRDGSVNATLGSGYGSGIYLDDCVSNVTIYGNVITGNNGSNTIHIHGGSSDVFTGNIVDLVGNAQYIMRFQVSTYMSCSAGTMSGNQFENNVVNGEGGGGGYNLNGGSPVNSPTITHNDYWNYAGSAISHSGSYTDASPSSQDPAFSTSTWLYPMSGSSAVLSAPVSFPPIVGQWGPPGYVIPNTGTEPSYIAL
jgi:hypothetical protein